MRPRTLQSHLAATSRKKTEKEEGINPDYNLNEEEKINEENVSIDDSQQKTSLPE